MFKIPALEKLVHELNKLPSVGPKSAQRLAYFLLKMPDVNRQIQKGLDDILQKVRLCPRCFSYTDEPELCRFCVEPARRDDLVCVIEEPQDILSFENSGVYRGRYHVLHGAISPLDGIGPEDLKIAELVEKVRAPRPGVSPIEEVILALDTDLEGDTTTLYLTKVLQGFSVKISRIASGVPLGTDIDYVDDRTLSQALQYRVEL